MSIVDTIMRPTIVVDSQSFWLAVSVTLSVSSFSGNTSGVGIRSKNVQREKRQQ